MSTMFIDAQLAKTSNAVGDSSVIRRRADGGIYPSNPAKSVIFAPEFPLGVGTSITAINIYLKGAGVQTITVTAKLHDAVANTLTVLGTPTTVAAQGTLALAGSALPSSPTSTQALILEITGLDATLAVTGIQLTYT